MANDTFLLPEAGVLTSECCSVAVKSERFDPPSMIQQAGDNLSKVRNITVQ
jgi:hypothetical protein